MSTKRADSNYQALAAQFRVDDLVVPYGTSRDYAGRVVAVYPGIGMVEVQFPSGNKRYPVEDLQRLDHEGNPVGTSHDTVPGGLPTVEVAGGPVPSAGPSAPSEAVIARSASRVAAAFAKRAIYWTEAGRRYRATSSEQDSGIYSCPKCKGTLRPTNYRRNDGRDVRLLACGDCLFLVRPDDVAGCHHPPESPVEG